MFLYHGGRAGWRLSVRQCACDCVCVEIHAAFDEVQKKVEMDVKRELAANHDNVTKHVDKVSLMHSVSCICFNSRIKSKRP